MPATSRRQSPPSNRFPWIVMGGAAGLVAAAVILRFAFGIDIFNRSRPQPQPIASAKPREPEAKLPPPAFTAMPEVHQDSEAAGQRIAPRGRARRAAPPQTPERAPASSQSERSPPITAEPDVAAVFGELGRSFVEPAADGPPEGAPEDRQTQTSFSGLFGPDGDRFEVLEIPGQPREVVKAQCKSIEDWGDQAMSAKSNEFRDAACRALIEIVFKDFRKRQPLKASEIAISRQVALKMLGHDDTSTRRCGARMLTRQADASCTRDLIAATKDRDAEVRQGACEALGWFGNDSAVDALTGIARRDPSTGVVETSVRSLAEIKTPRAKAALRELYRRAPTSAAKEFILAALDSTEK